MNHRLLTATLAIAMSVVTANSHADDSPELTALRLEHDKVVLQVQQEAEKRLQEADAKYVHSLDELIQKMTQAANLDGALSVREERDRVLKEMGLPAPSSGNVTHPVVPRSSRATLYNLGASMGQARVHASIRDQSGQAQEDIRQAQGYLNALVEKKLVPQHNLESELHGNTTSHDPIVALSTKFEDELRASSKEAASIYRLGQALALAEGQTASPAWSLAASMAKAALEGARTVIVDELQTIPLDREPLNNAIRLFETPVPDRQKANELVNRAKVFYGQTLAK